jgi:alpha/beta superfamily hydrolase
MKKLFFKTSDNLSLCGIWHIPEKETKKIVILAHGITADKDEGGIFTELAEMLEKANVAVFRFDFRGHGESEGKSIDMTIKGELLDLHAAIHEVGKHEFESVGLLGASFGGGIATLFAGDFQTQIKALCLWNPCLNYDHSVINPPFPEMAEINEKRKKEIREQGWTTRRKNKFVTGKALYDEMASTYPFEFLQHIIIPTCIIHGTNDDSVPFEDSKEYSSSLMDGEFISIEGGTHGFQNPQKQREEVLQKTVKFFLRNL